MNGHSSCAVRQKISTPCKVSHYCMRALFKLIRSLPESVLDEDHTFLAVPSRSPTYPQTLTRTLVQQNARAMLHTSHTLFTTRVVYHFFLDRVACRRSGASLGQLFPTLAVYDVNSYSPTVVPSDCCHGNHGGCATSTQLMNARRDIDTVSTA